MYILKFLAGVTFANTISIVVNLDVQLQLYKILSFYISGNISFRFATPYPPTAFTPQEIPQAWAGRENSRRMWLSDIMTVGT
jgi:hypothetical protein